MSSRLSILLVCLWVLQLQHTQVYAQLNTNYQYYGVENGLPSNLIKCLIQDKKGFIWLGTPNGLIRFDGKTFLNVNDIPGCNFLSPTINSLLEDNDSTIIVGTSSGVNTLNTEKFTTDIIPVFNSVKIPTPCDLHLLKTTDGSIYFILNKMYVVRRNTNHALDLIGVEGQQDKKIEKLRYVSEDKDGMIWAVTFNGDVMMMRSGETIFKKHTRLNLELNGLVYTKKFGYLLSSLSGLHSFDPVTNKTQKIFNEIKACSLIYEDASGDVWVSFEYERLYKLSNNGGSEETAKIRLADAYNYQINVVHKDPKQNMWVGTNFGLVKYIASQPVFPSYFTANTKQIDKLNTSTRVITEDPATGDIYFAAYSGTFRINKQTNKIDSIWLDKDYPYIPYAIIYDHGKLWIGTEGNGLYTYNISTKERKQYFLFTKPTRSPETLFIRFMYKLQDGKMLLCDYDQLILFDPHTEKATVIKYKLGPSKEEQIRCLQIIQGKDGNLWLAAENGIFVLNQKGEIIDRIKHLKVSNNTQFKCIVEQDEKYMWFGTENEGIIRYNKLNHTVKSYTTQDGLVNNRINGILVNTEGNLVISTQNGLSYFDAMNEKFTNFKVEDGLVTNEFNTSSFLRTANNQLLFGSINGLIAIPSNFKPILTPSSKLVWSRAYLYNTNYEQTYHWMANGCRLSIPYYNSYFELNFALTNYVNPERNTYYYRIKNVIDEWQALGNQNVLRFNELPAGEYKVEVMAYGNNNNASEGVLTMWLDINEAYYKTWWFIGLIILACVGVGYLIVTARMRQLKMVSDLRMTISSDLHDDVGSVLTRIAIQADYAKTRTNDNEPDVLTRIAESSRAAISNMRDVVWATDVRNDKALNLLDRMREHAESMLGESGIEYDLRANISEAVIIKMNVRQHLYLIYKEALNNIVKHAGATHVTIVLEDKNGALELYIKDNGSGNKNKSNKSGSGLANMRLRAKKLGAKVEIHTEGGYEIRVLVKSYKQSIFWKKLIWEN
jgi:ligand-binding sensor domain-containing protein/two-component sensor histidine kinase